MPDGGFVVKIDGKKGQRCYKVTFDYDEWTYTVNDGEAKGLPKGLKEIRVKVEMDSK